MKKLVSFLMTVLLVALIGSQTVSAQSMPFEIYGKPETDGYNKVVLGARYKQHPEAKLINEGSTPPGCTVYILQEEWVMMFAKGENNALDINCLIYPVGAKVYEKNGEWRDPRCANKFCFMKKLSEVKFVEKIVEKIVKVPGKTDTVYVPEVGTRGNNFYGQQVMQPSYYQPPMYYQTPYYDYGYGYGYGYVSSPFCYGLGYAVGEALIYHHGGNVYNNTNYYNTDNSVTDSYNSTTHNTTKYYGPRKEDRPHYEKPTAPVVPGEPKPVPTHNDGNPVGVPTDNGNPGSVPTTQDNGTPRGVPTQSQTLQNNRGLVSSSQASTYTSRNVSANTTTTANVSRGRRGPTLVYSNRTGSSSYEQSNSSSNQTNYSSRNSASGQSNSRGVVSQETRQSSTRSANTNTVSSNQRSYQRAQSGVNTSQTTRSANYGTGRNYSSSSGVSYNTGAQSNYSRTSQAPQNYSGGGQRQAPQQSNSFSGGGTRSQSTGRR